MTPIFRRYSVCQAVRYSVLRVHPKKREADDKVICMAGVDDGEVPPVPIPNTEVKLISAENTWRATAWEDRAVLTLLLSSVGRACGC